MNSKAEIFKSGKESNFPWLKLTSIITFLYIFTDIFFSLKEELTISLGWFRSAYRNYLRQVQIENYWIGQHLNDPDTKIVV